MIEKVLTNIVEAYYPKGVSSLSEYEKYVQTDEFKKLKHKLNTLFDDESVNSLRELISSELQSQKGINDISDISTDSFDRCLTFKSEIVKGDTLYQLCLNISLLTPYYLVYILKNKVSLNPYQWLTNPTRDKVSEKELFNNELNFMSETVERITSFKEFPEELINKVIPDTSYADIEIGEFTFLDAFFLSDIKL